MIGVLSNVRSLGSLLLYAFAVALAPCRRTPQPCLFAPRLAEGILGRQDIPASDGSSIIKVKRRAEKAQVRDFVSESVYSKITLGAKAVVYFRAWGIQPRKSDM